MLEIKNLAKHYGNTTALSEINLAFAPGEIVGLFGENGAGKTTLFKCVLNFIPFTGEITLDGEKITHRNIAGISYGSSNNTFFSHLTVSENKNFYAMSFPFFNESRFDMLVDFFELPINKLTKDLS